jgi:hypothetical protein
MIDEMHRPLGHPPTAAPRTESPALARQGDEAIQSASVASKSDEAAGEASAPHEVAELLLDNPREPLAVPQRTERLKMVTHDPVQDGRCGIARVVCARWRATRSPQAPRVANTRQRGRDSDNRQLQGEAEGARPSLA